MYIFGDFFWLYPEWLSTPKECSCRALTMGAVDNGWGNWSLGTFFAHMSAVLGLIEESEWF